MWKEVKGGSWRGEERIGEERTIHTSDYYVVVFFPICAIGRFFGIFGREWPGHFGGGFFRWMVMMGDCLDRMV